jgi:hypothetical protein
MYFLDLLAYTVKKYQGVEVSDIPTERRIREPGAGLAATRHIDTVLK